MLINGATGASGRLAVQIARHLGAGRIVATGRRAQMASALTALGADAFIALEQPREDLVRALAGEMLGGIDIVLDYLWGASAEALLAAAAGPVTGKGAHPIRFVNMGSIAGATITLPAGSIRSSGVMLMGSGLGSVSHAGLVRAIGAMLSVARQAGFAIDVTPLPLSAVETAWRTESRARVVLTA